ncbi:MAG: hypothetical protein HQK51_14885 [Oligoflexia bacterium]|nr:hypothetical protein [Oligoflexia bacterium]
MKTKILKITLIIFFSLTLLLISTLVFLHFLLQSPKFIKGQLPTIQSKLKEKANIDLNFEDATINILGKQHISNLELSWKDPQIGDIKLKIKNTEINYSLFDLLTRKFFIRRILIDDSNLDATIKFTSDNQAKKVDKVDKNNTDEINIFKQLEKNLNNSLLKIETLPSNINIALDSIEIKNLNLFFHISANEGTSTKSSINIALRNLNWIGQLKLNNKMLSVKSNYSFSNSNFEFSSNEFNESKINISSSFSSKNQTSILLSKKDNDPWSILLDEFTLDLNFNNLNLRNKSKKLSLENSLENIDIQLKNNSKLNSFTLAHSLNTEINKELLTAISNLPKLPLAFKVKLQANHIFSYKYSDLMLLLKYLAAFSSTSDIFDKAAILDLTKPQGHVNSSITVTSTDTYSFNQYQIDFSYLLSSNKNIKLNGILKSDQFDLLEYNSTLNDNNRTLNIESNIKFWNYKERLQGIYTLLTKLNIKIPNELSTVGDLLIDLKSKIEVAHNKKSIFEIDAKNIDKNLSKFKITSNKQILITQNKKYQTDILAFKPITVDLKFIFYNQVINGSSHIQFDQLSYNRLLDIDKSKINIKIINGSLKNKNIFVDLNCNKLHIFKLDSNKELSLDPLLKNISLSSEILLTKKQTINIENLLLKMGGDLLTLNQNATIDLSNFDFQSQGKLYFNSKNKNEDELELIKGIKHHGSISIPWNMASVGNLNNSNSNVNNSKANISGKIIFNNFSLMSNTSKINEKKGTISAKNINGEINFSEEIELNLKDTPKSMKFAYLLDQNPFERVDFIKLRPLLNELNGIRISSFSYNNLNLGPIIAEANINQNMLSIKNFSLNILSGDLSGAFYLDLYPKTLRLGILGRITDLNPSELNSKDSKNSKNSNDLINARTALAFDLNKKLIEGRLDITKIGRKQLLALINHIDPEYRNEQLNQTRSALRLLTPTNVSLAMKQGYLDMDIIIESIGISKNFNIKGIPISGFIKSALDDIVIKINEVPIK